MALKFSGILIRCPAPVEFVVSFSLSHELIGLREKITEEKNHFHSVWRGVLQACAMLCGLGTPVGVLHYECVPSPVLWQASRGERRQEGQAQENYLGQTSIRIHSCSSLWNLPPSQFTFGAQADPPCYMCSWFIWTGHVSIHPQTWWLLFRNVLV